MIDNEQDLLQNGNSLMTLLFGHSVKQLVINRDIECLVTSILKKVYMGKWDGEK
jgi:hypothetical protein